jgi:SAM-dependent methyltransferase
MSGETDRETWHRMFASRKAVAARFGDHFTLPLERKVETVVARLLAAGERVLDVGAHERQFLEKVEKHRPGLVYRSLDPERGPSHDYAGFDEVKETFDAVYLFEVLEHVDLGGIRELLGNVGRVLRSGGRIFCSTPCIFHPGQFLRDATHRTPLAYDELGGLLETAGFHVEKVLRLYNAPWARRVAHVHLAGWLHRFLRIDYATSILIVARWKEKER